MDPRSLEVIAVLRRNGNGRPPESIAGGTDDNGEAERGKRTELSEFVRKLGPEKEVDVVVGLFSGKYTYQDWAGPGNSGSAHDQVEQLLPELRKLVLTHALDGPNDRWATVKERVIYLQLDALADAVVEVVSRRCSGVFFPKSALLVPISNGWYVRLGIEEQFARRLTRADVKHFCQRHRVILFGPKTVCVGVWRGKRAGWILDMGLVLPDRSAAGQVASREEKESLVDLRTGQVIWLGEEERRAA